MKKIIIPKVFKPVQLSLLVVLLIFLESCTSNTIFEKPKDLISKDSMSLLIQEMMIASSSKNIKNINNQRKINYMPFVYDAFKIDSLRFRNSSLYYMSKIDVYEEILTDAHASLKKRKEFYRKTDSVQKDSIKRAKNPLKNLDSTGIIKKNLQKKLTIEDLDYRK